MDKISDLNVNKDTDFIILGYGKNNILLVSTPWGDLVDITMFDYKNITTLERFLNKNYRKWKIRKTILNKYSRK